MKYHIFKATRVYMGAPYSGPTTEGCRAESDSLDEAVNMADALLSINPVGWIVYNSETMSAEYSTSGYKPVAEAVFVVTMFRCGDTEAHSYVLGVWSTVEGAASAGAIEEMWRGNKYKASITQWVVDANEFGEIGE